jgi:prophage regulatory protein
MENNKTPPRKLLLDVHEVADMLGIAVRTIYKLISMGEFPKPKKIGRANRWRYDDLEGWAKRP